MPALPELSSDDERKLNAAMVFVPEEMRADVEQDVSVARLRGLSPAAAATRAIRQYRRWQRGISISQIEIQAAG